MEWVIGNWRLSVAQVQSNKQTLQQRYNHLAPTWHTAVQKLGFIKAYTGLWQTLCRKGVLNHINQTSRVLDAGIGTGGFSQALLQVLPTIPKLVGTDISHKMLAEADWRLQKTTALELTKVICLSGLESVEVVRLGGPFWCHWMSVAAIGFKKQAAELD